MKPYIASILIGILIGTIAAVKDIPESVDGLTLGYLKATQQYNDKLITALRGEK